MCHNWRGEGRKWILTDVGDFAVYDALHIWIYAGSYTVRISKSEEKVVHK